MKRFLILAALLFSIPSGAQETWSITFRPTLDFPNRTVLNAPLRIGNGAHITAEYALEKQLKLYAGLSWNRLDSDQDFNEVDIEFIQRGILLGGMYFLNIAPLQKNPLYLRAGLTFMDIQSRSVDTAFDINTQWALGAQLGVGMKITSFKHWYFLPELQYGYT